MVKLKTTFKRSAFLEAHRLSSYTVSQPRLIQTAIARFREGKIITGQLATFPHIR